MDVLPRPGRYLEGLHIREQAGALHASAEMGALRRRAQFGQDL